MDPLDRAIQKAEEQLRTHRPGWETIHCLKADGTNAFRPITVKGSTIGNLKQKHARQAFGRIVLHNHSIIGGSFSEEDLRFLLDVKPRELLAISRTHRYSISADPSLEWEDIKNDVKRLKDRYESQHLAYIKAGLITPQEHTLWLWHRVVLRLSSWHPVFYHTEPLK